jgi:hypothetical protein
VFIFSLEGSRRFARSIKQILPWKRKKHEKTV